MIERGEDFPEMDAVIHDFSSGLDIPMPPVLKTLSGTIPQGGHPGRRNRREAFGDHVSAVRNLSCWDKPRIPSHRFRGTKVIVNWKAPFEPQISGDGRRWKKDYRQSVFITRAAACTVRSISSGVCAVEMNPASNCDGAR